MCKLCLSVLILKLSFFPPFFSTSKGAASSGDLLDDLFGGPPAQNQQNLDFFANFETPTTAPTFKNSGKPDDSDVDLLCDPVASLLGRSAPTTNTFQGQNFGGNLNNLNFGGGSGGASQPGPFLQPTTTTTGMPSSSSFHNLNSGGFSGGGGGIDSGFGAFLSGPGQGLGGGAGKIPKNSSSPNLLSDLILDDIMFQGNFRHF